MNLPHLIIGTLLLFVTGCVDSSLVLGKSFQLNGRTWVAIRDLSTGTDVVECIDNVKGEVLRMSTIAVIELLRQQTAVQVEKPQ